MTQVLPFRAFRWPAGGAPRDDIERPPATLVTSPGINPGRSIPDGATPLFSGGPGGFLVLRHDYDAASGVRKSRLALLGLLRLVDRIVEKVCLGGGRPVLDEAGPQGDHVRFWTVVSGSLIEEIVRFFADRVVYLMDGLHVYRAYRRLNEARDGRDAGGSNGDAAGCPLTVFANLCDFGVDLTAYHLLVKDLPPIDINELVLRLTPFFDVKSFPFDGAGERSRVIGRFRQEFRVLAFTDNAVGAYFGGNSQLFLFRLREDVDRSRLYLPDVRREHHPFDAFLLRHVILDRFVFQNGDPSTAGRDVEYARTMEEAVHSVASGRCRAAFFLNPPTKRRLTELLQQGLRLPPGSVAIDPPLPGGLIAHLP